MNKPLNILYVGALWHGGTCLHRKNAIQEIGHNVIAIDTHTPFMRAMEKTIIYKTWHRIFGLPDLAHTNENIIKELRSRRYDVLWIDKGLTIKRSTLQYAKELQKNCVIVGYSPDDMTGKRGKLVKYIMDKLPYYDIYFTTKTYCVPELKEYGCPRVEYVGNAYDKYVHYPIEIKEEEKRKLGGPVGFIGQSESERAKSLYYLAYSGIEVRVWGIGWEQCKKTPQLLRLEKRPLWQEDYTRAICSFDINLCFLRKDNRDVQTTRTIEIPACGAFMLAERTDEHLALFEEGKEAEYFGSDEELLDKIKHYLTHQKERINIARAGRERCIKSGYSNHDRMKEVIRKIRGIELT